MAEDAKPAAPEVEDAPQDVQAPDPDPVLDGVFIVKNTDESGTISVTVHTNGHVLATEVQTLLEMALPAWREKIGLPAR